MSRPDYWETVDASGAGVATGVGAGVAAGTAWAACGAGFCAVRVGVAAAEAGARAGRASKAAAVTGTSFIVACVSASLGTGLPSTVMANACGRAVQIIGPFALAGTA